MTKYYRINIIPYLRTKFPQMPQDKYTYMHHEWVQRNLLHSDTD